MSPVEFIKPLGNYPVQDPRNFLPICVKKDP